MRSSSVKSYELFTNAAKRERRKTNKLILVSMLYFTFAIALFALLTNPIGWLWGSISTFLGAAGARDAYSSDKEAKKLANFAFQELNSDDVAISITIAPPEPSGSYQVMPFQPGDSVSRIDFDETQSVYGADLSPTTTATPANSITRPYARLGMGRSNN